MYIYLISIRPPMWTQNYGTSKKEAIMRNVRMPTPLLRHLQQNQQVGEGLADTAFRLMGLKKPSKTRAGSKYYFHTLVYGESYRYQFKTKKQQDNFKRSLYQFRNVHKINITHQSYGLDTHIQLHDPDKLPYRPQKRSPNK